MRTASQELNRPPCAWPVGWGDFTGFSGNSPKNRGERSDGAIATQAGVERESTATLRRTGEEFSNTRKAIEYRKDARFRIVWLTKMLSNRSLVASQQSGGEFSEMRIVRSTIQIYETFLDKCTAREGGFFVHENANVANGWRGASCWESSRLAEIPPTIFTPSLLPSTRFSTTC
ncbi:MAG: hypothetical protein H7839_03710 [Magnetococcus sp. YQC-5]